MKRFQGVDIRGDLSITKMRKAVGGIVSVETLADESSVAQADFLSLTEEHASSRSTKVTSSSSFSLPYGGKGTSSSSASRVISTMGSSNAGRTGWLDEAGTATLGEAAEMVED